MADTTATQESLRTPHIDSQRRAWGILLLSFAVFCLICVGTGIGVIYFLFQSPIPLDSVLGVGRGTGVISGQAVYGGESRVSSGALLRTDRQSQVTIFFRDPLQDDRLIAAVTLRGDTTLTAWQMMRPRFEWSSGSYAIELRGLLGKLDIFVPDHLEREFRLTVRTQRDDLIYLDSSGQYVVSMSDTQAQVSNRGGVAYLTPADSRTGRSIPLNSQGTIVYASNPSEVIIGDAPVNLLANSTFQGIYNPPDGNGSGAQVLDWACTNSQDDLPRGIFQSEINDGRHVLRLLRDHDATSHGETRCGRFFGQYGQDITAYNYLSLRATFKIGYQSLNVCGFEASECPMMLQIDYRDVRGIGHHWIHGFYALLQTEFNSPLQCNSCAQEHEYIYPNTWYTYDTDNIFNLIAPDLRPVSIANVQFYASGHQYDVYVGEVALLAGNINTP